MPMLVKGEAIILRRRAQGETSKICVLMSRQFGKMSVVAKGARSTRSRYLGVLEPYQHVQFTGYMKEGRDLHYLSGAEIIDSFPSLHSQLGKMSLAAVLCEVIEKSEASEHVNPKLFALLLDALGALEREESGLRNVLRAFFLHFARLAGFEPALERCRVCDRGGEGDRVFFFTERGNYTCAACAGTDPKGIEISEQALNLVRWLNRVPLARAAKARTGARVGKEVDRFLLLYLRQHVEGLEKLKSLEVLQQLENGLGK